MHVGILQVVLHVPDAQSLKDKRRIVKGLLDRARQRFSVAAAEVDDHDAWQTTTVGFATVSNDARVAASVMEKLLAWIRETPAAHVVEHELETL
jgi:uncharacterized protein YlxP (DUF503 family)